ncbi:MAG: DVU0298 family protein [Desulforhopalus sp.]
MSSRIRLKKRVLSTLQGDRIDEIYRQLAACNPQQLINPLFSALCSTKETVRWHAVCCFGRVVPKICTEDIEAARIVMRRFLWALNDESGGIGWGVPEAMAEVMCHSRLLRREYVHMLVSYIRKDGDEQFQDGNYLELPMLQRGVLWGVGRLCQAHPLEMRELQIGDDLADYLDSEDVYVRALALRCIALLGGGGQREKVSEFIGSDTEVCLFIDNAMQVFTVGQIAVQALGAEQSDVSERVEQGGNC